MFRPIPMIPVINGISTSPIGKMILLDIQNQIQYEYVDFAESQFSIAGGLTQNVYLSFNDEAFSQFSVVGGVG